MIVLFVDFFASKEERIHILEKTDQKIAVVSADHEFFGKFADDPNNWIIMAVFIVGTLVLLLVVVYLVKHKVNHAEEHYEEMKSMNTGGADADGEVAA